jgi:hypothetical protein
MTKTIHTLIRQNDSHHNVFVAALIATAFLLTSSVAMAQTYQVKVINLTRGQVLSPPAIMAHNSQFTLFEPGRRKYGVTPCSYRQ